MNVHAILFDYGMVLSAPADRDAHKSLLDTSGLDEPTFERHYWANRRAYDAGELDAESYWKKVASHGRATLTAKQIQDLIRQDVLMWTNVDHAMLSWALKVKAAGHRIGIVSNICRELARSIEVRFRWIDQFDYKIWSCRIGVTKPDEEIFRYTLRKLRTPPADILYIDDREENITVARSLGMTGIVYRTLSQLDSELRLLGVSEQLPPIVELTKECASANGVLH